MLPAPACDETGHRLSLFEERAVGVLAVSIAWDKILDHNLIARHELRSALEESSQLSCTVGSPGFVPGLIAEMLFNRGFDRDSNMSVDLVQLHHLPYTP